MKRLLFALLLLPAALAAVAQEPATPSPEQLTAQIASLRVARTLQLTAEQVAQIQPLLQQVAAARATQAQALEELWAKYQGTLQQVDAALVAGRRPDRAAVTAAEQASKAYDAALAGTDDSVAAVADKVAALLSPEQTKLVESARQQQARQRNADRFGGAADLTEHISTYAVAMRELSAEEYDELRGAVALRLAGLLVPRNDRRFDATVGTVLRVLDTVRRMSDADFGRTEAQLPQAVARALGLQGEQAAGRLPVTYNDFLDFVGNAQTPAALELYQPGTAAEVNQ